MKTLSNMVEIPYEDIDDTFKLEAELTVEGQVHMGSKIREAFEDTGYSYKVPIAWGIQKYGLENLKDKSVRSAPTVKSG